VVSAGGIVLHGSIPVAPSGMTQLYSLKVIEPIPMRFILVTFNVLRQLCNFCLPFCLLYESIMIKGCNIQFDLFVFETWFSHIKERTKLEGIEQ
jgi:hypothetical protein